jgi:hypothetical protein
MVVGQIIIEGILVVVAAFVLFGGAVWLLTSAVMGVQLGYLITATATFGFLIILTALWSFGAPGTPPFLGPKGDLPAWIGVGAGTSLSSPTFPVIQRYPDEPWQEPGDAGLTAEVEPATLALQEFLAEEASAEVREAGIEGEVTPEQFEIQDLRFTEVDDTQLVSARAFANTGGPEVEVFGYKDPGNESLPSYLFLAGSVLGFLIHLPFLDRAERKRKEVLTGGEQAPWRGPA